MMKKLIVSLLVLCPFVMDSANAINVNTSQAAAWGWQAGSQPQSTYGDFILAGGLQKVAHGTYDDEFGLVGLIANKIVEHGGYFCPYQLQCANKRKKKRSWTEYYRPTGFNSNKCAWLCETGYSGTNCLPASTTTSYCDTTQQTKTGDGKYAGLKMKTSGGRDGMVESEIIGFEQKGSDPECDVILGVVKFMDHGVIAAPLKACCGRDNWKNVDSFVNSLGIVGDQKILCAPGYKPNSAQSDCEPIDADACATQNLSFCSGFERAGYDSSIHTIQEDGGCVKYFCSESGKAFASASSTACEECSTGVKGGSNPKNGTCVKCETGQYFDSDAGTCKTAAAYTTIELQYGKGKTKNTNSNVATQCWTLVDPAEYAACVANGGVTN